MSISFLSSKGRHVLMVAFGLLILCRTAVATEFLQGSFKGIVIDIETNQPVSDATVRLDALNRMYKTASDGSFEIKDIAAGKYTVRITHVGYRESRESIVLSESGEKKFYIFLEPKAYETAAIVVTSEHTHSKFEEITEESSVLKGKELQKELGLTLASTLKNETGLAIRSMGPAPARPVIRGLGGDRVHISEDGQRTTDLSATSPDHAVTIEPFSLERIEVIRGPKVLLQSPTTIGGVINVVRHEIPLEQADRITGTLGAYGETVNKGYLTSLIADVPLKPFMLRGEISQRNTSDLSTPIGTLKNSESDNVNYSLGASWIPDFGFIGASFRDFSLDYGVPGGFVGAHPNGVLIEMEKRVFNLKSRINIYSGTLQNIETHLSRSYYRHKEFESNGSVGADFQITNVSGYANLNHTHASFFDRGTAGVSFDSRNFDIGGNVFTPSSTSQNFAVYFYEAFTLGQFNIEAGARYNFDRITPDEENPNSRIGDIRERIFHTYSLSLSALYPVSEALSVGANVSKSSRVPSIEELFSEGPHLAAYSYEVGNPDLKSEQGIGTELFLYYKSRAVCFLLSAFRNDLSRYIIPRNTGEINWRLILPIYQTFGVDALLYGGEAEVRWLVNDNFTFRTSVSYTVGTFKDTGKPLPMIPPLKGQIGLSFTKENLTIGLSTDWTARQRKVDEFEEPTAGYVVFNTSAQYSFMTGAQAHSLSLTVDNIFDTEYRNHLSRVKSIMPEAGRNFRLTYKLYFDL